MTSPATSPIRRVLVANRGEIAVRVLRTLRRLGLESVLAVSGADRDGLGARLADRVLCVGPARATDSYLNIPALVHAALASGAHAVHPGYGFLSERADFARACEEAGLVFVGPTAAQIERVGDKLAARALAVQAGVPVAPGGPVASREEALALAERIGYPVLVKAVGGGGGRGLKRADDATQLAELFDLAGAEAEAAFGDSRVYVECFVARGRHVEVQVLGDGQRLIHLGDRDCSVQRRYQKLIEEAPAPALDPDLRAALHAAACRFAEAIAYRSLGTVEFLVDVQRRAFYFLEMNARIQVEHPVTEMVTGTDLIREMILVAAGERLSFRQEDIRMQGHAMEFRINAEDPEQGFKPSPGTIHTFVAPAGPGVRWDSHAYQGYTVPPYYDSMVGKLIIHRPNRKLVLDTARRALHELTMDGIKTTAPLFLRILDHSDFAAGEIDTGFIERHFMPR